MNRFTPRIICLASERQEQLSAVISAFGWPRSVIIRNVLHAHYSAHRRVYQSIAVAEAIARGLSALEFYDALLSDVELKKGFMAASPKDHPCSKIQLPETQDVSGRMLASDLEVNNMIAVFLRLDMLLLQRSLPRTLGAVATRHLADNWESRYAPTIDDLKHKRF